MRTLLIAIAVVCLTGTALAQTPPSAANKDRGKQLYLANCFACHQLNGQGVPGVFPPLAKSDFLMADKERSIRILCEGLGGKIEVNGRTYNNYMPPVVLNDEDVATVLNYVRNEWGNSGEPITPEEVKKVRATTSIPTFEALVEANRFAPLPKPPEPFAIREVVRMTKHGVRMASNGDGKVVYVLCEDGDVWRLEPATGSFRQILWARKYLSSKPGDIGGPLFVLGLALDKQNRLYIGANQQNNATLPVQNRVTLYRTTTTLEGDPADPKPWFEASYPGNSAYVHGMEEMKFGPDGFLYVGNGARTDANQSGSDTNYFQGGETPLTACIWRLDAAQEKPEIEIFARGLRNPYGFAWNDQGEMFATENGPDADAPEELNWIRKGRHYGFPYRFADWTHKAYPHTPDAPPGLEFTLPIANLGPDGGFYGKPVYSFDPHSCPSGLVWLGDQWPEPHRNTLLAARFGNFIRTPKDHVGFDILQIRLNKKDPDTYEAKMHTFLAPLGRPIDIHLTGKDSMLICEYSRPTNNAGSFVLPGRILELKVAQPKPAQ